jgi:hypothetical protein
LDGQNPFYIGAGLGEYVIACSPTAYRDGDGRVVLNYVAVSITSQGADYAYYQRKGWDLDSLDEYVAIPEPFGIPAACRSENARFAYTVAKQTGHSFLMQYDKMNGKRRQ